MKNCIIIKFYRNENFYTSDYHDLMIDVYPKLVDELATFLQSKGKELFFTCHTPYDLILCNPMAEILYTGEISQEEKEKCIETLKLISSDWIRPGRRIKEVSTLRLVRFHRIEEDELVFVNESEVDCSNCVLGADK